MGNSESEGEPVRSPLLNMAANGFTYALSFVYSPPPVPTKIIYRRHNDRTKEATVLGLIQILNTSQTKTFARQFNDFKTPEFVCVGIVGERNTGKSFLLSMLIQIMKEANKGTDFGDIQKSLSSMEKIRSEFTFKQHDSNEHVTVGIDAYIFFYKRKTIVLFDCMGLEGSPLDLALVAVMCELCSVLIWNWASGDFDRMQDERDIKSVGPNTVQALKYAIKRTSSLGFRVIIALRDYTSNADKEIDLLKSNVIGDNSAEIRRLASALTAWAEFVSGVISIATELDAIFLEQGATHTKQAEGSVFYAYVEAAVTRANENANKENLFVVVKPVASSDTAKPGQNPQKKDPSKVVSANPSQRGRISYQARVKPGKFAQPKELNNMMKNGKKYGVNGEIVDDTRSIKKRTSNNEPPTAPKKNDSDNGSISTSEDNTNNAGIPEESHENQANLPTDATNQFESNDGAEITIKNERKVEEERQENENSGNEEGQIEPGNEGREERQENENNGNEDSVLYEEDQIESGNEGGGGLSMSSETVSDEILALLQTSNPLEKIELQPISINEITNGPTFLECISAHFNQKRPLTGEVSVLVEKAALCEDSDVEHLLNTIKGNHKCNLNCQEQLLNVLTKRAKEIQSKKAAWGSPFIMQKILQSLPFVLMIYGISLIIGMIMSVGVPYVPAISFILLAYPIISIATIWKDNLGTGFNYLQNVVLDRLLDESHDD